MSPKNKYTYPLDLTPDGKTHGKNLREERYCEIAAKRMAQEVLPLHDNASLTHAPKGGTK